MIIFFISEFYNLYLSLENIDFSSYSLSEFLINLEGGFVRRGVFGQGLYEFCRNTGLNPYIPISVISACFYLACIIWFFKQFHKKGLNWWILVTTIMFGFTLDIVRKDFLQLFIFICVITILNKPKPDNHSKIFATLLTILSLFIHEAYIFWGFPFYALLIINGINRTNIRKSLPFIIPVIISFFILCHYKGNPATAIAIQQSWHNLFPDIIPAEPTASVWSLTWDTLSTIETHLTRNLGAFPKISLTYKAMYLVIAYQLFFCFATYYLLLNIFSLFPSNKNFVSSNLRTAVSCLYIISIICLLPMFLGLSCDMGRIYLYSLSSTLAILCFIPESTITRILPRPLIQIIESFNRRLDHIFKPRRIITIFLLLFLGMSPYTFNFKEAFESSVIGQFINLISTAI